MLKQCIRAAKKNCYIHCFETCKSDMKETWRNINTLLGKTNLKKDFPKLFLIVDEYVSDQVSIDNAFKEFLLALALC